jgi:hypothetical protein
MTTSTSDGVCTRRDLLKGVFGGVAAFAAAAVANPESAAAAVGNPVLAGKSTGAGSAQTKLTNNSATNSAFLAQNNGSGAAVEGTSPTGIGGRFGTASDAPHSIALLATNNNGGSGYNAGSGIRAFSGGGTVDDIHPGGRDWDAAGEFAGNNGIIGATNVDGYGVIGLGSFAGTGVWGGSEDGPGVVGRSTNYGLGVSGESFGGSGVMGRSTQGRGVLGESGEAAGVSGHSIGGSGVYGRSEDGVGVYGSSGSSYAGRFDGRVHVANYLEMRSMFAPPAPFPGEGRIFLRTPGSGKTELCVRFNTGTIRVIAVEP